MLLLSLIQIVLDLKGCMGDDKAERQVTKKTGQV